jgi:hypothetical protein
MRPRPFLLLQFGKDRIGQITGKTRFAGFYFMVKKRNIVYFKNIPVGPENPVILSSPPTGHRQFFQ